MPFLSKIKIGSRLLLVILSIGSLTACEKPNPTPELSDPIYSDLMKESEGAQKDSESVEKEAKKLADDIEKLEPRDPTRGGLNSQRLGKEKQLNGLLQRTEYFKIRADQRLDLDRRQYLKAFDAKKTWPDPNEYSRYKAMHNLQTASRNWDDRVPKTTRYNKAGGKDVKKPEAKSEEKKE